MSSVDLSVGCRDGADSPLGLLRRAAIWLTPDRRVLFSLLGLALTMAVIYALITPALAGPDEDAHYDYVRSLWDSKGTQIAGRAAYHQPAYYWVPALGYAMTRDQPRELQLVAMRVVSSALFLAEVLLAYLVAKSLSSTNRFIYMAVPAIVALLPGRTWIGAMVNDDNLASLASAAVIYFFVQCMLHGLQPRLAVGFVVAISVAVLSKITVWPVVAVIVFVLAVTETCRNWKTWTGRLGNAGLSAGLLVAAVSIALLLARDQLPRITSRLAMINPATLQSIPAPEPEPFVFQFKSYWLPVLSDDYSPPDLAYQLVLALILVALVGLALGLLKSRSGPTNRGWVVTVATLLVLIPVVWVSILWDYLLLVADKGSFIATRDQMWGMHGRYLYPALVPVAYLVAAGAGQLIPPGFRPMGLAGIILLLLVLNGIALFSLVSQIYWWSS